MELKEFVEASIHQVLAEVREAASKDLAVAPAMIEGQPIWTERLISFEVNVTTDATAKSGIRVFQIADAGGELKRTTVNRISFSVPVHMNVAAKGVSNA